MRKKIIKFIWCLMIYIIAISTGHSIYAHYEIKALKQNLQFLIESASNASN